MPSPSNALRAAPMLIALGGCADGTRWISGREVWDHNRCTETHEAFARRAGEDLSCPPPAVSARRLTGYDGSVVAVAGCGRRALYLHFGMDCIAFAEAGGLASPRALDLAPSPPVYVPLGKGGSIRDVDAQGLWPLDLAKVSVYAGLVTQGARDLACPAGDLSPSFVPVPGRPKRSSWVTPTVDGCGKRATYDAVQIGALLAGGVGAWGAARVASGSFDPPRPEAR